MIEKIRSYSQERPNPSMLPKFYLNYLQARLRQAQIVTLEILVWLLQVHKDVRIEKLASHYPLPIKQESRPRHLQRFLSLPDKLSK